jgi:hypothetical protein
VSEADDDFFETANLFPATTGPPIVVWVSERGRARHDVRIKSTRRTPRGCCRESGDGRRAATPRLVFRQLSAADIDDLVTAWVRLSEASLVAYWEYRIDYRRVYAVLAKAAVTPLLIDLISQPMSPAGIGAGDEALG